MNLFEKHLKKKKDEVDVVEDNPRPISTGVKKLEEGTDISFFQTAEKSVIPELQDTINNKIEDTTYDSSTADNSIQIRNALDLLEEEMQYLSTGLEQVDRLLHGGLEPRSITEVYGSFATGKTQFCFQCASQVLKLGKKVLFIDTEGTFRPSRILDFLQGYPRDILRNILTVEAQSTDQQLQITTRIRDTLKNGDLSLVIIDSLTALFRAEFIGEERLKYRQQLINKHLRDLLSLAMDFKIPVLVTNQVIGKIEDGELKNKAVGGNIVAHGTTHRLEFTSERGSSTKIITIKDSPNLPIDTAKFRITSEGLV